MSDRKTNKIIQELLLPGETNWELWRTNADGAYELAQLVEHGPGSFSKEAANHTLALSAVNVWVLPAWIKGEANHLQDMASLHLERMDVRTSGHAQGMSLEVVSNQDTSHLVRITALKDQVTPLADHKITPRECRLSALCLDLPANALVLWKELGRMVLAITSDSGLLYFAPLSSTALDTHAISEINHICLQLSFQRVIQEPGGIFVWTEGGDVEALRRASGLPVHVGEKPTPTLTTPACTLMPLDLIVSRQAAASKARRRLLALSAAFVLSACVAVFTLLIGKISRERDALLEQVAAITPRASKVESQRAAWQEAAPAIDPDGSPLETLLRLMEPPASSQITLTELEWTPSTVLLRGRAAEISPALKYMQEIKDTESLMAYNWEPGTPEIGENGAAFEVKGEQQ